MTQQSPSRDRGRRLAGVFVLGMALTIALAPAASAQIPSVKDATTVVKDTTQVVNDTVTDPGKTVTDTTNKVGDTVTDTGGKVGDTVTDTGGKVGDTAGGTVGKVVKDTTDKVGTTVKDGTKTTGDAIGTVGSTAGEAVSKVYNDTMKSVDEATGGDRGEGGAVSKKNKKKSGTKQKTSSSGTLVASGSASRAAFPLAGSEVRYIEPAASVPALETTSAFLDARTPQQLFEAAVEAAKRFAFPLALTILVVAFLLIQNRIDSRDPKLATASITFEEDLLSFS